MKKFLFIYLFISGAYPVFAVQNPFPLKSRILVAAQDESSATFNPFIDYGEFQDDIEEEESIIFFQKGRSLTLSMMTGYEAVTFNMRQIYGDTPFMLGFSLGFFIDLRFAFQINGIFPYGHYSSLLNDNAKFSRYGVDLRYYLTQQYLKENPHAFNAYITFGPFWMRVKQPLHQLIQSTGNIQFPVVTPSQQPPQNTGTTPPSAGTTPPPQNISNEALKAVPSHGSLGVKIGLGFEMSLIKQSYIGMEVSYLYTKLPWEEEDLSKFSHAFPPVKHTPHRNFMERLQFPHRPQVEGYRFIGDVMNVVISLGINF